MNKKDQKFFDEHWEEWVDRNPPPFYWMIYGNSVKHWAELEMQCRGFLGRLFFRIGKWLSRKRSS